ncbi:MAG: hypothetical protein ABFD24_08855 [Anaerolineaceae bacterium]
MINPGQTPTAVNDIDLPLLFEKMKVICPALTELEYYEFCYALESSTPKNGWNSVDLKSQGEIERMVNSREFYAGIQSKPRSGEKIILDNNIVQLSQMLLVGLTAGKYTEEWVKSHFFFDVRGFLFFHRTVYFTDEIISHLGGKPYRKFEQKQQRFENFQGIGYKDFMEANSEIEAAFMASVIKLVNVKGTPLLMSLAGPTAAGKTEITSRLFSAFHASGRKITTIEMDNFLLDRDTRGENPMGKMSTHFNLFTQALDDILRGRKINIPRYDFITGTSSHDLEGNLRAGCTPLEIESADIIFLEGNFPFHIQEVKDRIGIKVVYLTDDPIRLKRKWKRDMDYRKKYNQNFFLNRFFKTQYVRAVDCYQPQMRACDIVVDTTNASLWVTPKIAKCLN